MERLLRVIPSTITIAGTGYTYTEKSTDTPDTIAKGLVALINKSDPNVTANFGGGGSGTVYLSSISKSGAESVSLAYDSLTLATSVSNVNNVTAVASGSYLSAGNAATASPGSLVEVNAPPGVTFSDTNTTYVAPTTGSSVPNTVNGVQLYVDGFASPLYKVTPTQLVGQIPYFYGDRNSASVYVRTVHNDGSITATNATPVYIAPANPGIFDQQQYPNQTRPWPIALARHQLNNPTAVVSIDGTATANDTVSIFVNGSSTPYTYTVTSTDTSATSPLASVVTGLVNLMQNDPYVVPSAGGAFTRLGADRAARWLLRRKRDSDRCSHRHHFGWHCVLQCHKYFCHRDADAVRFHRYGRQLPRHSEYLLRGAERLVDLFGESRGARGVD